MENARTVNNAEIEKIVEQCEALASGGRLKCQVGKFVFDIERSNFREDFEDDIPDNLFDIVTIIDGKPVDDRVSVYIDDLFYEFEQIINGDRPLKLLD